MKTLTTIAVACLATLAGCGSLETTVEVRNETRRSVSVTLERDVVASDAKVLARQSISAGDSWLVGPVKTPPFEPAMLRVRVPGDLGGLGAEVRLPRGRSTAVIESARIDSWGEISVRLIGTKPDEDE
ncbi:MAG: hypothetical protein DHS20C14_03570 [Phycisphaeraceae bacterium]|nr:MAG: hypothetical protein DHS20C14_03570 [Phycisphaeraceae bacterium]